MATKREAQEAFDALRSALTRAETKLARAADHAETARNKIGAIGADADLQKKVTAIAAAGPDSMTALQKRVTDVERRTAVEG